MKQLLLVYDTETAGFNLLHEKLIALQTKTFKNTRELNDTLFKLEKENNISEDVFSEIYTIENYVSAFNRGIILQDWYCYLINIGEELTTQHSGTINIGL